jgi:hypothetical protein
MRELAGERFVLNDRKYSPAVFDKVITLCTEAGFSPKIGATATVSSGVLAGEGLAMVEQRELAFLALGSRDLAWAPHSAWRLRARSGEKPPANHGECDEAFSRV